MATNIEIIETALEQLIDGHSAPAFEGPQFASLIDAIKSLPPAEYHALGAKTLQVLLDRMSAGMNAERVLQKMRDGNGDSNHTYLC